MCSSVRGKVRLLYLLLLFFLLLFLSPSSSISTHSCRADTNPDWSGNGIVTL